MQILNRWCDLPLGGLNPKANSFNKLTIHSIYKIYLQVNILHNIADYATTTMYIEHTCWYYDLVCGYLVIHALSGETEIDVIKQARAQEGIQIERLCAATDLET